MTDSGGRKYDGGKPRYELLPFDALDDVVRVLTYGAAKYTVGDDPGDDNWRKVEGGRRRYLGALLRHVSAYQQGERLDPETGLPHLAHAVACGLFVLALDG